jgi:quercetin dioxygenase-like cupin family protein
MRTLVFDGPVVSTTTAEWAPLEAGDEPSRGARLAVTSTDGGVTFLLVDLEANGFIAMHSNPEVSVCYVAEGEGTVLAEGGDDVPFGEGDTIRFGADVRHAWRGGSSRTLLAVTLYPSGA